MIKQVGACALLGAITMPSLGGGLVIAEFALSDDPDGNQSPPPYGLRLDNVGAPGVMTLSMAMHDNTTLSVIEEDGAFSIRIQGTLHGDR